VKFGICNEIFQGWSHEDAFAFAHKAGYDAIEIAPFTIAKHVTDISREERARIRGLAARAGIAISGLHWVLAQTEGMHLTEPDGAVRARTAAYFVEIVKCCADLGGTRIIVGSPKQRSVLPGVTYEQAWQWATEGFREAVKHAEDAGIVICFEPLAPSETNFVNTAEEGRRFAGQFASPAMSIILDVKAMSSEPIPIPQIIHESASRFPFRKSSMKAPGNSRISMQMT
jgi:sugar phosphate isomerase/epimerase